MFQLLTSTVSCESNSGHGCSQISFQSQKLQGIQICPLQTGHLSNASLQFSFQSRKLQETQVRPRLNKQNKHYMNPFLQARSLTIINLYQNIWQLYLYIKYILYFSSIFSQLLVWGLLSRFQD